MEAPAHGRQAETSPAELGEHGPNDPSHSTPLVPDREDNETRRNTDSNLNPKLNSQRVMDRVEVNEASGRAAEGETEYEDAAAESEVLGDGNHETRSEVELIVQESHVVAGGADLASGGIEVYVSYEATTEVVEEINAPTNQDAVDGAPDYAQEDFQERGADESGLEENVHGDQSAAYMGEVLPDLNTRDILNETSPSVMVSSEHSNFSAMQQEILRAQILVYGDLIKGKLPDTTMMASAFSDADDVPAQAADRGSGGWNWEGVWQVAVERAEKLESERLLAEGEENVLKGDVIMTEGEVLNGADNLEPGTPSTSPSRVAAEALSEGVHPQAMPQATDTADRPVADLSEQPTEIHEESSAQAVNLDAVVDNIVSTFNPGDSSHLKEPRVDAQGTRSPSLDPWLKPHTSPLPTAPGSLSLGNSPSQASTRQAAEWVSSAQAATPGSVSQGATVGMPSANTQVNIAVIASEGPVLVVGSPEGSGEGAQKRRGRARDRKTPDRKTPASRASGSRKAPASKDAGSAPRRSRAKNTRAASPIVPSRLIYESPAPLQSNTGKRKDAHSRPSLHAETQNWLEQAKASFQEALSAANSAADQEQLVKSQTASQSRGSRKEAQMMQAAAAVNAAASVARAAADAAKVACEAAKQAAMIVCDGLGKERTAAADKDRSSERKRSSIAAVKEEARKRAIGTSSAKVTPQSTDAVLKAARLMADAAGEAGAVLAKGSSDGPLDVPQSTGSKDDAKASGGKGRSRKDKRVNRPEAAKTTEEAARKTPNVTGSMKKGARRKGKAEGDINTRSTTTPVKKSEDGHVKTPEKPTRRQLDQATASASDAANVPDVVEQSQIREGSMVEVMNEEEGLRGGWFSGRVLEMKEGKAYVQYDEILNDDGVSQLKEWFPVEAPSDGTGAGQPRIRLISPSNIAREEGRRKKRRTASGQKVWNVGDMVDAFVQDGWWEGVVKAIDDNDENKITVHFPGEGDTTVVKSWNMRPSLLWKDGKWQQWSPLGASEHPQEAESLPAKKQKVGISPKAEARKSKRKATPEIKNGDEGVETPRASKRKTADGAAVLPASPPISTRASPRQKLPSQKDDAQKDEPAKLATVETEVSTPTQVSTPVSTRARSAAPEAVCPVKEPRKGSGSATANQTELSASPAVKKRVTKLKQTKVVIETKKTKVSSTVTRTPTTRQKAKAGASTAT